MKRCDPDRGGCGDDLSRDAFPVSGGHLCRVCLRKKRQATRKPAPDVGGMLALVGLVPGQRVRVPSGAELRVTHALQHGSGLRIMTRTAAGRLVSLSVPQLRESTVLPVDTERASLA